MRFFTNESKDDRNDAHDVDVQDRDQQADSHPEAVSSDPVPVPQQRSNSPWSSTPESAPGDQTDDSPAEPGGEHRADDSDRVDSDQVESDRADSDLAETDRADSDRADSDRAETHRVDEALDDRGTFDDPQVSDAAHAPSDADADRDADALAGKHEDPTPPDHAVADTTTTDRPALKDDGDFDDPKAVDPASGDTLTTADDGTDTDAVVAATPRPGEISPREDADRKPGEVESPQLAKLFGDDAGGFADRLRDVQLRFVDSPKEAVAEAAALVDEAVDKLSAGLKEQKAKLGGASSEDTEKLRVELRAYRDLLNRITNL